MWKYWVVIFLAACGDDDVMQPPCGDDSCASDCAQAGFGSGVCVENTCQCTAPAAQPGTITGTALLFGHDAAEAAHDHAGIAVTVVGAGLTAMTAADGSYSIAQVPAGTYTLSFTRPQYHDADIASVVVTEAGTTVAPPVTLSRGTLVGPVSTSANAWIAGAIYSPDRAHTLLQIIEQPSPFAFQTQLVALASDGSAAASIYNSGDVGGPLPAFANMSNDTVVYQAFDGVWSRPFDASVPPRLLVARPAGVGGAATLSAVSEHFAIVRVNNPAAAPFQVSYVAARTDGSGVTPLWAQTSYVQSEPSIFASKDSGIAFTVSDGSGATTAIHHVDPGTGTDTAIPLAGYTMLRPVSVSPDRNWALIAATEGTNQRAIVVQIGTTTARISPPGFMPNYNNVFIEALADSSGFTFEDYAGGYSFFGTTVTPSPNPVRLIAPASYIGGAMPTHLFGSVVTYTDAADTNRIKLVTVPTAAALVPATYDLDARPVQAYWQLHGTELLGVWTIGSPIQLKGTSIALPVTAAPSAATLGTPLSAQCTSAMNASRDTGVLADAFFYLCPDTNTLSRFSPPFTGAVAASVLATPVASMQRLATGGVAYRRGDGTWWTADPTSNVLLSRHAAALPSLTALGKWAFFTSDDHLSRVSRLDGTAIDEPLTACRLSTIEQPYNNVPPFGEPAPALIGANVFAPTAVCPLDVPDPYVVPQANLP